MNDCTVLARSLVGMGAVVSPGTIISEDVFLAAGPVTEPGQTPESGWLYGGEPYPREERSLLNLDRNVEARLASRSLPQSCR